MQRITYLFVNPTAMVDGKIPPEQLTQQVWAVDKPIAAMYICEVKEPVTLNFPVQAGIFNVAEVQYPNQVMEGRFNLARFHLCAGTWGLIAYEDPGAYWLETELKKLGIEYEKEWV